MIIETEDVKNGKYMHSYVLLLYAKLPIRRQCVVRVVIYYADVVKIYTGNRFIVNIRK